MIIDEYCFSLLVVFLMAIGVPGISLSPMFSVVPYGCRWRRSIRGNGGNGAPSHERIIRYRIE